MKLEAQNVSAGYGDRLVLRDVTLQCAGGAFVGLIGPNGCGKSTLLRALSGILNCRHGCVLLDGQPLAGYTPRDRARRVAFVPQEEKVAFEFTVRDVVLMGRFPYRVGRRGPSEEDYARVDRALAAVDITALQFRSITELSGGEHRRVLLARALAQQTPLLLLDEPTAHLDITHQAELLSLARRLAHPTNIIEEASSVSQEPQSSAAPVGVLAALHDLNQAAEFCDRLVLMVDGQIIAQGTPEQALTPANIRTAYQADADIGPNPITGKPMIYALHPLRSAAVPPDSTHFFDLETPPPDPAS